ncbi:unnamed protein product [Parnassius mnemosyne]|uniref:Tyr recombinase domain-containing protein n=1 Tax=Parnassius mnemosyne TaxID=213953 RepID=A0AAV1K8P9_9NEOP
MMASLSKNTTLQYSVSYKLWWQFCHKNNLDPYASSVPSILLFLSEQFNNGAAYGSLNNHRSALSLLLGDCVGSKEQIKRFLKGAYKLRPALPKYTGTWDPKIVLNHIGDWVPNETLSIEKLTKKLAVLMALCTAHRAQTLSLIKIDNIKICSSDVRISITDIIKTSAAGRQQPLLILPYFIENINICPATAIKDYLEITNKIRPAGCRNLLLTYRRPHKAATAQSISRWIKNVLAESGVDVTVFSAHSTRHAVTSAARSAGVSLDTIRKTAGWSSASETFAKFYHRQIIDGNKFARTVLLNN